MITKALIEQVKQLAEKDYVFADIFRQLAESFDAGKITRESIHKEADEIRASVDELLDIFLEIGRRTPTPPPPTRTDTYTPKVISVHEFRFYAPGKEPDESEILSEGDADLIRHRIMSRHEWFEKYGPSSERTVAVKVRVE